MADLEPFAAFGWEARGGYGDAYQTAQAFAVTARAAGVRIHQGANVTGLLIDGDRVTGVRIGRRHARCRAGSVVVATGVWTGPFLAPYGIDVPIHVHREQIVTIKPGVDTRSGARLLRSGLAAIHSARAQRRTAVREQRSGRVEELADPDDYLNRPPTASSI